MSQQINLFNPRFRKEKRYLTAPALALMVGAALFASVAVAVAARSRVTVLETESARLQAALREAEVRKQTTLSALVPRAKDATVDQQLARAEQEHRALRGVADILEQNRVGDPRGYSAYFEALARTHVSGLWLTGVDVDGSAADIGLRGRALRAELLPGYLGSLAREPALQGKAFGSVEIARPAPVTVPAAAGATAVDPAPAAAPAAPAAPVQVVPPYIEFSLRSSGDKPAAGRAMKAMWLKWAARIDALSLRERAMAGAAAVAAVIFIVYMGFIEPAHTQERTLRAAILQQRAQLAGIDVEIAQKQAAAQADPDAAARKRLAVLRTENDALRATLRNAQRGLVQPNRMSALLQQMVQQNGRLKLVSLKTLPPAGTTDGRFADGGAPAEMGPAPAAGPVLPVTPLTTTPPGVAPAPLSAPPSPATAASVAEEPLLYRHGVRIVLQGAYADMVAYMRALERLPVQVFWGKAALDATEHDKTTLTLTLYTLSLDEKWIAL